jgi:hypothetical protein
MMKRKDTEARKPYRRAGLSLLLLTLGSWRSRERSGAEKVT